MCLQVFGSPSRQYCRDRLRFDADHHRLYLALHQLVFDCVSLYRVILPELVSLYDAAGAGAESALPEPGLQYADYAVWLRARARGTELGHRIDYWRHHLDGAPALHLPLDHPRPLQQRFQGAIERPGISRGLADELRSLRMPTLLVFGDRDFSPLSDVVELYGLLPDARLAVLPGTTHMDVTRRPDELLAIVTRFLDSC